jgi:ubiquitin C-terminal hydrolase
MGPYCSSTTNSSQSRYDLFGIINHRGSAWFGHYTSYARLLSYNDPAKTEIGKRIFQNKNFFLVVGFSFFRLEKF